MEITLGQQYNIREKPTVVHYLGVLFIIPHKLLEGFDWPLCYYFMEGLLLVTNERLVYYAG